MYITQRSKKSPESEDSGDNPLEFAAAHMARTASASSGRGAALDLRSGDIAVKEKIAGLSKTDAAKVVGATVAERAKEKGVEAIVFDRGGYLFHGRVLELANAAREAGLKF